jgi:hypothetical protein
MADDFAQVFQIKVLDRCRRPCPLSAELCARLESNRSVTGQPRSSRWSNPRPRPAQTTDEPPDILLWLLFGHFNGKWLLANMAPLIR